MKRNIITVAEIFFNLYLLIRIISQMPFVLQLVSRMIRSGLRFTLVSTCPASLQYSCPSAEILQSTL